MKLESDAASFSGLCVCDELWSLWLFLVSERTLLHPGSLLQPTLISEGSTVNGYAVSTVNVEALQVRFVFE